MKRMGGRRRADKKRRKNFVLGSPLDFHICWASSHSEPYRDGMSVEVCESAADRDRVSAKCLHTKIKM